jgi:hypothetical protein
VRAGLFATVFHIYRPPIKTTAPRAAAAAARGSHRATGAPIDCTRPAACATTDGPFFGIATGGAGRGRGEGAGADANGSSISGRGGRLFGAAVGTAIGTSVHVARRARAQLAAARAAAITLSRCSADVSFEGTYKNYNRFLTRRDE